MVSGIEGQDFELYAVRIIVFQGDVFQVVHTGAAHVGSDLQAFSRFPLASDQVSGGYLYTCVSECATERKPSAAGLGFSHHGSVAGLSQEQASQVWDQD